MNSSTLPSRSTYVQTLLKAYLDLPETPLRSRPVDRRLAHQLYDRALPLKTLLTALLLASDRRLAHQLYDRALPLKTLLTALLLASARRLTREPQAPPLQPIRSLHYFVPVIEEVLSLPLPDNYLPYLKLKMCSLAPTQKSNSGQRTPAAPVQESAFSEDR